jgi:hypothetical protein
MSDNLAILRRSARLPVVLPARCRTRSGFVDHVVITDLSRDGCRYQSFGITVKAGDLVVIRPEGLEGLCGVVRWVKNHKAGIEFERPLYVPVVEHIHRTRGDFRTEAQDGHGELRRAA